MITLVKQGGRDNTALNEWYGLSTDNKPTENVSNGDIFVEMDSGKIYFYSEEDQTWVQFGS